jgi:hypothetical protein
MDETRDMPESLDAEYREIARDEVRESEALEWAEATIADAWPDDLRPGEELCET